ncbi:MAG: hypothetical protein K2F83_07300 [Oscillospiraceae bacterium]|nr:hypothetical protein [Oscillospiraceae bacterium]
MKSKKLVALLLASVMCLGLLAGCGPKETVESKNPVESQGTVGDATYTHKIYSTSLSSNWNPHDYEDSGSSDVLTYLYDGFYQFVFNDELHPHADPSHDPYDSYVIIPSMAIGDPVDVTMEVKAAHPEWIPEEATSGYAWQVTLRDDLYFDTGYHITAQSYVEGAKRLLDPKLQNYRSTDVYSNSTGIVGAEAYFKQGSINYKDNGNLGIEIADMTTNADGQYTYNDELVYIGIDYPLGQTGGNTLADYVGAYGEAYFGLEHWDELVALADDKGLIPCTDDNLALLSSVTTTNPAWNETDADLLYYLLIAEQMPDGVSFDTVGIYAKDEYTLVEVFKGSLGGFTLYYGGLQDTLLLVEPDVYDSCLKQDEAGNWYSTYMTSAETSPSYGPYSMTAYQTDKMVHYSKNDKWYGWNDDVNNVYKDPHDGQVYHTYMTTDIDWQVVDETATAKNMFLSGELTTYSMQSADYDEYGFSEYLYATPSASVMFTLLTGNLKGLQEREAAADFDQATQDVETIAVQNFRKAFAISFDKQGFVDETTPSTTPAFGIYGQTQIYDPETCGFYRDTDQAKQVLVDFYSIDLADYNGDVDAAIAALTGYDPDTAKELYTQAFQDSLDLGYITDNDNDGICDQTITITWPVVGNFTEAQQRRVNWLDTAFKKAVEGTPFEGKVGITPTGKIYDDSNWADALKSGEADLNLCGWTGSVMDPYNLITAYTWPSYAYAAEWYDTTADMLTLTIDGEEITMSVYNWADAVNGSLMPDANGTMRSFGENDTSVESRLTILAGIEGKLLQTYTYIPFINNGSKFLLSQKVYYVVEDYNPVMSRGGVMYMKYNYTDAEWEAYCAEQIAQHGQLQY